MEKKNTGFLVTPLRPDEIIYIGDDIEIAVSKIDRAKATIAIKAPKHIKIITPKKNRSRIGSSQQVESHSLNHQEVPDLPKS